MQPYLKKIIIQDFQRHVKRVLELATFITCIVGDTDSGKSASLRAPRWAMINDMRGTDCIRRGSNSFAVVKLLFSDGTKIVRKRGPSKNEYWFNNAVYKSFGQGCVPEDIENYLRVNFFHFTKQHDLPFLFSESAPERSRILNSVINLEIIDTTLSNASKKVSETRSNFTSTESRLNEAKQQEQELSWVELFDKDLQELEQKQQELTQLRSRINLLESLTTKGNTLLCSQRNAIIIRVGLRQQIAKVSDLSEQLSRITKKRKKLEELLSNIQKQQIVVNKREREVVLLHKKLVEATKERCPLCGRE